MAPREGQLRLFRLHPFPLPLFEDRYLIPDVKNDVLAISSTSNRLNVQMAAVDLLSCHRINQLFMCDNFGVLSKKFNTTCLGALYYSLFDDAQRICKFKVVTAEEQAYQIRKGEFVVYLPKASTINISCRNGTQAEQHLRKGSQTIQISKGCQGELEFHRLISDYSDTLGSEIKIYQWNWDSVAFLEGTEEKLHKALAKLADVKVINPDLSELRYIQTVPDMDQAFINTGYILTFVSILMLIIGLCVCGFCLYRKCPCCQCNNTPAVDRRGQKKKKTSSSTCGLLCCCCMQRHSDATEQHRARFQRGSDTDEVELQTIPRRSRRLLPTHDRIAEDIEKANRDLEKRLSTLERTARLSRNYDY